MVSREFIFSKLKKNHTIAVHMKGNPRLDGLTHIIYVIIDLVLDEQEEQLLIMNTLNNINTNGILKIKALRTSEIDIKLQDDEPKEYVINTKDIEYYESYSIQ